MARIEFAPGAPGARSVMMVAREDWIGLYWFIPDTIIAFATAGFEREMTITAPT
jgi:hypothetical protein